MAAGAGAMKSAAMVALLLVLVLLPAMSASANDATTPTATMAAASGRRGAPAGHGRYSARPMGLTQCVTGCGSTVTSCLLRCYTAPSAGDRVMLPVCLLDCTNDAMFCAADCSGNLN